MKKKLKSLLVPGIYVVAISAFVFSLYFVQKILSNTLLKDKNLIDTDYVDKEIIKNNDYLPVVSDTKTIIKPFTSSDVKVSKEFYVYNGEEDSQKNSIIYYENTYMQNSGIDYYSDNSFDVISILDGTVIDVKSDNIVGSIVEIRHTNNLISLYQSLGEVNVKVDDKVVQGQIIGKSGQTNLNTKVDNNLHFELYYNGEIVNPNDYFDKNIKDL